MTTKQPLASVIINTYNRTPYLRRLLAGLNRLRGAPFEVVVVNGPSTDGTAALLEEYRGRIKVIDCPARNLSHSRNLGIAAAAGEVVIFIDDDALPVDTRWLLRYIEAFSSGGAERLGAAGGPVLHRDTEWFEFNSGATSDYGFQVFDSTQIGQMAIDGVRWLLRVQGCNCAFQRSALVAIGGFDTFFTYYHDETDVCLRLARAGFRTTHLPENAVRHYPATSERRTTKYDRNWRVVTRSDTYFALKNGADPLPVRLARTLASAPRKHYVREIVRYWRSGEISTMHWLRLMGEWAVGLAMGLAAGLLQTRSMGDFSAVPAPFCSFAAPRPQRQLRIALLSQTVPGQPGNGGVGRYTFDLARGLHERGHEVHVICKDEQALHHHNLGFVIHGLPAETYTPRRIAGPRSVLNKNLSYSLAVVHKLAELYAKGLAFDVVHASNWDVEAVALIRAQVYPTVLMLVSPLAQVIVTEQWQPNDDLRACLAVDRWQIEHADMVCVPSEGVLSSYGKLMDIVAESLKRLRLAPLGIVPDHAPALTRSSNQRRLLFVGRCERRKGAHTLLEVLPALLIDHPDWECHLVGNDQVQLVDGTTLKQRFLAQHSDAPWISRVIFHGIVDEETLREHYRSCDLFVAPSLFESCGLIYHEAMQYGKAVVGCRTGGVPEVVEHDVEGLLVTPDSPHALRAALAQLMRDDALRERMGQAGAQRVRQIMNYQTMAIRMEQIYFETIAQVGAERRAQREQLWPRELPLFEPSDLMRLSEDWVTQEAMPGQRYRLGQPGATLAFEACGGTILHLVALRHSWSGVIEVRAGMEPPRYIDLYKPGELQLDYTIDLRLPGAPDKPVTITLLVHSERNPASQASQVWLKQIVAAVPPATSASPTAWLAEVA
jgi:glycogen synthase